MRIVSGFQKVASVVADGPVVVLAGTVDSREGLFMEEADKSVFLGFLPEDFHDEHVVVAGEVEFLEQRGDFILCRSDFVVAGFRRDAESPESLFNIGHEGEDAMSDGTEVVVFKLLVLRRRSAEQGASGLHEVGTCEVEVLVDQEVLLFGAECDFRHMFAGFAEAADHAFDSLCKSRRGFQQRGLLVKGFAGVGAERSRDAERCAVRVTFDERRAGGIPCGVSAGFEGGAETAGGEA